jgi:CO/xanthine dehydrogenase Mo-binding subunit
VLRHRPERSESYSELLARNRMTDAEATGSWRPPPLDTPGLLTFGAQFAEVAVDPELGLVRVRRMVGAFAPGRVLNPKLAGSQLLGGMLWGLGQALLEGNEIDTRSGRWGATSLGDYLVPVNADAPTSPSSSSRSTTGGSIHSASRASARSARLAPPLQSPTRCSTPLLVAFGRSRSPPS